MWHLWYTKQPRKMLKGVIEIKMRPSREEQAIKKDKRRNLTRDQIFLKEWPS